MHEAEQFDLLAQFRDDSGNVRYSLNYSPRRGETTASSDNRIPSSGCAAGSHSSDYVHVRRYRRSNWATSEGVAMKRRQIERKGLPSFRGWKFGTLTIDRELFDSPLEAYLAGKARLCRWMDACRRSGLWSKDAKWAWKLEFQEDGWPHWHILLEHRAKWSVEEMQETSRRWKFGRVNWEAVRTKDYLYSFKYAFKPVLQRDEFDLFSDAATYCLPDWFLDYVSSKSVTVKTTDDAGCTRTERASKPQTFARIRFWQTSRGFYTGATASEGTDPESSDEHEDTDEQPGQPLTCLVPYTSREQMEAAITSIQVVSRDPFGRYLQSTTLQVECVASLWASLAQDMFIFQSFPLGCESFVGRVDTVTKHAPQKKWQLQRIAKTNQVTPRKASRLEPRNWRTC